jgi:hypothetical protein
MCDDGTRVVLVKPGDVLVFGHVSDPSAPELKPLVERLKTITGAAAVVFFRDDIDMANAHHAP